MATPSQPQPSPVNILVLDKEGPAAVALRQVLDSEGWRVRLAADNKQLLTELRVGVWSLIIANVDLLGLDSPAYIMLRELAAVPFEEGGRVRCLFRRNRRRNCSKRCRQHGRGRRFFRRHHRRQCAERCRQCGRVRRLFRRECCERRGERSG